MICLDDCASERLPRPDHEQSVQRTISWAKQCQKEFQKQLKLRRVPDRERPLLFAVIQGGNHKDLRSQCAAELVKIGFDGYGFGGWPMLDGKINYDILSHTANTMPDDFPKYALGVGKPDEIIVCARMGYSIFDCVLPTRDARHQRLYIAKKEISKIVAEENPKEFFSCLDIQREIYYRDTRPLSEFCQCSTCLNYSRAYLRHLFQIKETAAFRLATIHNLQVYTDTINALRSLKH
jgi:queuine tRNA-ribosyltransferase